MAKSAVKIVTDAILGKDMRLVRVGGKSYVIEPPTIYRLAGAANCLDAVAQAQTLNAVVFSQKELRNIASALSWFIRGDDTLTDDLMQGSVAEVQTALKVAYGLLSTKDFLMLSLLARNVAKTVANQKQ